MSKKWMALVAMTALIGSIASVGCSSDDANDDGDKSGNTGGSGGGDNTDDAGTGDQDSGTEDDGGSGGGDNQACGSNQWNENQGCMNCMKSSCCDELAACDVDSDCYNLFECVKACEDQACANDCVSQYNAGLGDAQALLECETLSCAYECGYVCDTDAQMREPACAQCLGDNCCDEFSACWNDQSCRDCLTGQGSEEECLENDDLLALDACWGASCTDACGVGAPICDSGLMVDSAQCAECLGTNCCDVVKACADDELCRACITREKEGAECNDAAELLNAIETCWENNCSAACSNGQ